MCETIRTPVCVGVEDFPLAIKNAASGLPSLSYLYNVFVFKSTIIVVCIFFPEMVISDLGAFKSIFSS